jgi:hypothetical protein
MAAQAITAITTEARQQPESLTLLELVRAVSESTNDDRLVIATVRHMLRSGRVKLRGCFRDEPIETLLR